MANPHRGEVEVTLDGKSWTLRPTFEALCEIEDSTGVGIAVMLRRFGEGSFGVRDVAAILAAGIAATGKPAPGIERIGEIVVEQGIASFVAPIGVFLAGAVGIDPGGKAGAKRTRRSAEKNPAPPGETAKS